MVSQKSFLVVGGLALAVGLGQPAVADTARAAVGKPLQQAEALLQKHKFSAALEKVHAAGLVKNLTPYEALLVAQIGGAAAAGAGDYPQAAHDYETALDSGSVPEAERVQLIQAIAGYDYRAGNYPQAIVWLNRYVAAGGTDAPTQALLAQAYYQSGNFADAAIVAREDVRAITASGKKPPLATLQLLASSAKKVGDQKNYWDAHELLLKNYPSPSYWAAAIDTLLAEQNFPDGLMLDVYRLRFATGTLTAPGDYEDYAERAILAQQPDEAKLVIARGFAENILTAQTDGGHALRLQTLVDKEAAAPNLRQAEFDPGAPNAALNQGVAQYLAGDRANAIATLKAVPGYGAPAGPDPAVRLARLWVIRAESTGG